MRDLVLPPGPSAPTWRLLTPVEAAHRLGVSQKTLAQYRWRKIGPPYLRLTLNGPVRYQEAALTAWVAGLAQGNADA